MITKKMTTRQRAYTYMLAMCVSCVGITLHNFFIVSIISRLLLLTTLVLIYIDKDYLMLHVPAPRWFVLIAVAAILCISVCQHVFM
jgi:hypothetical protein